MCPEASRSPFICACQTVNSLIRPWVYLCDSEQVFGSNVRDGKPRNKEYRQNQKWGVEVFLKSQVDGFA